MKRAVPSSALFLIALLAAPALRADVKTTEKSTIRFEGMMGAMLNRMTGAANGITSTVAVKGSRMSRMTDSTGQVIDLSEQKIYNVDVKRKEYSVMTFAEMRAQMEKLKADMEKQKQEMSPEDKAALQDAAKQLEFDVNVSETGQQKAIAGQNTKEVVLTLTMRQAGRKLEESGGLVMTNNLWLAPPIAALEEQNDFNMKFFKAVYGDVFGSMNPQQMGAMTAMIPGLNSLMERMAAERKKLQGTPLSTTTVIESVKSAEQMKGGSQPASGGSIGGMIAGRFGRGRTEPRAKVMTTTIDILSIGTTVAADEVAVPATFKEKK